MQPERFARPLAVQQKQVRALSPGLQPRRVGVYLLDGRGISLLAIGGVTEGLL
jgi:hypothetical protein